MAGRTDYDGLVMNQTLAAVETTDCHVTLLLPKLYRYAGTAVLGDGVGTTRRIVNLKVRENFAGSGAEWPSPEETINAYGEKRGWSEESIGMLTSASMNSYAASVHCEGLLTVEAHLTAGLSNARAAGDTAEYRIIGDQRPAGGTINTILVVHHPMELSAALELLMICAGAKARSLAEAGIRSRVSDASATGTGTDSTVVLYRLPIGVESAIRYAGMHTLVGELAAKSIMDAMKQSLKISD